MSRMHAICEIQQQRRAEEEEEEHVSPKELQLVPLPVPVPAPEQKKLLLAHIFVLVLALFAVAFVVVSCAVVRLICDTFCIILVVASTKVCLLFRYAPCSLSPLLLHLPPLHLKLLPLFHCQQDSQSHTDTHTLHVRILNMCVSVHPCLCCCYSEACDSWPNRLRYARV